MAPFENSTNGSVVFTLDHFADRSAVYPDISVCAEIYQDVHHCIVGHASEVAASNTTTTSAPTLATTTARDLPLSTPSHSLSHIQRIYSHPQAFGQCTKFLDAYLRGVETIDCSSTSRAAELARDDATGTSAAISSATAAEVAGGGVQVLARNIEDREDNTTRFFVLKRQTDASSTSSPPSLPPPRPTGDDDGVIGATKSLMSFTVPHRSPGALAGVLDCFRKGGLNLTSINLRPSQVEPFQYIFFVEFEGHRFHDAEGKVRTVMEEVGKVAQGSRWLGSWVAKR